MLSRATLYDSDSAAFESLLRFLQEQGVFVFMISSKGPISEDRLEDGMAVVWV